MGLPTDAKERKDTPIYSGVLKYFPDAIAYVAKVSKAGNDQHNPGKPLHWSREKSGDHHDCVSRHLIESGTIDPLDGLRHSGKLAWRALAILQLELEAAEKAKKLVPSDNPADVQENYKNVQIAQMKAQLDCASTGHSIVFVRDERRYCSVCLAYVGDNK